MFELMQGNHSRSAGARCAALLCSVSLHGLLIAVAVLLPLIFLQVLPTSEFLTFLIAAPTPPPLLPEVVMRPAASGQAAKFRGPVLPSPPWLPPDHIPSGIPAPGDEIPAIPAGIGIEAIGSGLTGWAGSGMSALPDSVLTPAGAPRRLAPPPPPRNPTFVGGRVQDAKLLRKVLPVYPEIAIQARISGDVVLEVTVDEDGNVGAVRVLRGHPTLIAAAVDAVKQWKYSPTLLNSEPVPVFSYVTVTFRLDR